MQKDAEKLFNILFSEQNTTAIFEEIEDAEELQIVFQPPNDGKDSDKDDAPSDNEETCANIKDIETGILSQSAKIRIIDKRWKKRFFFICHIYHPFKRKRIASPYFGRDVRTCMGVAISEVYGPPVFHRKAGASR